MVAIAGSEVHQGISLALTNKVQVWRVDTREHISPAQKYLPRETGMHCDRE